MSLTRSHARRPIEIFLSYSTVDKLFASSLKDALGVFGVKAFLAHQDLSPSVQWQETIVSRLHSCEVFVPILTKDFSKSSWTDQESGIAFALNKFILPIKIHSNPYGFLSRYQALIGNKRQPPVLAEKIVTALAEHKPLRNRLRKYLINAFGKSESYVTAIATSRILLSLSPLTAPQLKLILDHAVSNKQIYNSVGASRNINELVKVNKSRVNAKQLARLRTR